MWECGDARQDIRNSASHTCSFKEEGGGRHIPGAKGVKEEGNLSEARQQYFLVHSVEWVERCRRSPWPPPSLCLSQFCPSFKSHMNLNTP